MGTGKFADEARHELEFIGEIPPQSCEKRGKDPTPAKTPPNLTPGSDPAAHHARELAWKHYEYGRYLAQSGWLERATKPLDRAIHLWPDEARFYLTRGLVRFDLGRREEAVADLKKAHGFPDSWVQRRAADELELMGEPVNGD